MKNRKVYPRNWRGITFIEAIINIYIYVLLVSVCMMVSISYIKTRVTIRQKQQAIEEISLTMNEIAKNVRMSDFNSRLPNEICVDPNTDTNASTYDCYGFNDVSGVKHLQINVDGTGYQTMLDRVDGEFYVTRPGSDQIPLLTMIMWKLDKKTGLEIPGTKVKTSVSLRNNYE